MVLKLVHYASETGNFLVLKLVTFLVLKLVTFGVETGDLLVLKLYFIGETGDFGVETGAF